MAKTLRDLGVIAAASVSTVVAKVPLHSGFQCDITPPNKSYIETGSFENDF